MTDLPKWSVLIEYGPTYADAHQIVIEAATSKEALNKAKQWAKDAGIASPAFSEPYKDDYDNDWTVEEDEEFTHLTDELKGTLNL